MKTTNFDTLSQAVNFLTIKDFSEDFRALYSKKGYLPEELKISASFRFEGIVES